MFILSDRDHNFSVAENVQFEDRQVFTSLSLAVRTCTVAAVSKHGNNDDFQPYCLDDDVVILLQLTKSKRFFEMIGIRISDPTSLGPW